MENCRERLIAGLRTYEAIEDEPHPCPDQEINGRLPCKICWDLRLLPTAGWLFALPESLRDSAKSGCLSCSLLLDVVSCCCPPPSTEWRKVSWHQRDTGLCVGLYTKLYQAAQFVGLELFTFEESSESPLPLIPRIANRPQFSIDLVLPTVLDWIFSCDAGHSCRLTETHPLPKRVIDVGDNTLLPDVKLAESNGEESLYICLSHCWGPSQGLTTTSATLVDRKTRIPWTSLPTVFREAVNFTRHLGIRYLWIDSLCIIQDDTKDWQDQSAAMATTYRNSYITIAASICWHSHESMFPLSNKMSFLGHSGDPFSLQIRRRVDHFAQLPLMKRGWFFQERLLSPRVLHFGGGELIWECMERTTCECKSIDPKTFFWQGKARLHGKDISHLVADGLKEVWHSLVEDYSQLKLTYESDIFPALSGAAKWMERYRNTAYLAGLWRDSIVEDLLWRSDHLLRGMLPDWRAPSWSWASVGGGIRYFKEAVRYTYIEVTEVESIATGPDPTGEVSSARIHLVGYLQPVKLVLATQMDLSCFKIEDHSRKTFAFYGDFNFLDDGEQHISYGTCLYRLPVVFSMYAYLQEPDSTTVIRNFSTPWTVAEHNMWSLILLCISRERNIYKRVGILSERVEYKWVDPLQDAWIKSKDRFTLV